MGFGCVSLADKLFYSFTVHQTPEQIAQEALLVKAAQKKPEVFGLLYEKYYAQIFAFIFRRTAEKQLAADITAQTFLAALNHLGKYKFNNLPFSAWLYRIAINEINAFYKKSKRTHVISISTEQATFFLENIAQDQENNDELEKKLHALAQALTNLKVSELELIQLRFFDDKSFAEIGQILALTETNARVKTFRVLEKLKKILQKHS